MINIKDLRIGNWISRKDRDFRQVTLDMLVAMESGAETYSPIHLTSEIVTDCGFTFSGEDAKYKYSRHFKTNLEIVYGNGHYQFHYCDKLGGIILKDRTSTPICYVHQLQNIYYCLTGDELNLRFP